MYILLRVSAGHDITPATDRAENIYLDRYILSISLVGNIQLLAYKISGCWV